LFASAGAEEAALDRVSHFAFLFASGGAEEVAASLIASAADETAAAARISIFNLLIACEAGKEFLNASHLSLLDKWVPEVDGTTSSSVLEAAVCTSILKSCDFGDAAISFTSALSLATTLLEG